MTTIAVSKTEGVMAADTRVVTGGSFFHAPKIHRIGDTLWGTAGDGFACLAVVEWLKSPKRNPILLHRAFADHDRDDVLLVGLGPDGISLVNGWGMFERVLDDTIAIGSGGMAALEALRSGATAEDAIKRAMTHDEATGGQVQVEYLLPPELLPKRRRKR